MSRTRFWFHPQRAVRPPLTEAAPHYLLANSEPAANHNGRWCRHDGRLHLKGPAAPQPPELLRVVNKTVHNGRVLSDVGFQEMADLASLERGGRHLSFS